MVCSFYPLATSTLTLNRFDIIFLQETYSDPSLEDVWRAEWGGEIQFAHGSKHRKGVMTLFKPSSHVDILEITVDKNGRFLVANININQDNLGLVNIYVPNDQNQQVNFFDKIIDPIRRSNTNNILLGGDFNCPLTEIDKVGGRDILHKKRTIQAIQELCISFDLVDVWRTQHQNKKRYSWANGSEKIKCRLDFETITNTRYWNGYQRFTQINCPSPSRWHQKIKAYLEDQDFGSLILFLRTKNLLQNWSF